MTSANARRLRQTRIGLIGLGTMGSALITGLRAVGVPAAHIRGVEARASQRRRIAHQFRIQVSASVADLRDAQLIILAVKPQELSAVLEELRTTRATLVSIAAGITTRYIETRAGRAPVVRAMPNTAARVGQAVTAIAAGRWARRSDVALAHALFQAVGETVDVPERLMDAVTAVSGSGPAYFFWLTDQLIEAGVAAGLARPVAARLARRTAIGSAALMSASDLSPQELIAQVASKRGTTEAALRTLARCRAGTHVRAAVRAAVTRAKELACSS